VSDRAATAAAPARGPRVGSDQVTLLAVDDALVFAAKPPGVPSDRTRDPNRPSLIAAVEGALDAANPEAGDAVKVWIGHRLDRDTSGVVTFARTADTAAALHDAFARREAHKQYLAVVTGQPREPAWTADNHLAERGRLQAVVRAGGKRAITHFRVLDSVSGFSLIAASPITGRTHQIRVQLADAGLPIVGDVDYGGPYTALDVSVARSMLHAARVQVLGYTVDAPLWPDMAALLGRLGLSAPRTLDDTV